jgi:signal transduction histidine kinase
MSSGPTTGPGHGLALRLTLLYSGIFATCCALAFAVVTVLVVTTMRARLDEDLSEDIAEFAALYRSEGLARVEHEMRLDTQGQDAETSFFRIWGRGGSLVAATDLAAFPGLGPPPGSLVEDEVAAGPVLETLELPGRDHAVRVVRGALAPDLLLEIGQSVEEDDELVAALLRGFVGPLVAVALLGLPVGWFLARRALRGVEDITRTATAIASGALDQRVAVLDQRVAVTGEDDELARLARVFNSMLDRIQGLVVGLREMADHLAHDLRSPLTRIRAAAEMAQRSGDADAAGAALAATATEECDRLLEMINTNLEITETESGAAHLRLGAVDLAELARDACELFQPVAEDRGVELTAVLPAACGLSADRQRLQRVIANLLDNALKYTPRGGRVTVSVRDEASRVRLLVADTGVGILPAESRRIFERFYRSDRSRSEPGNGLGLALCLASVRAHGGEIAVESEPGQGSTFAVTLWR